MENQQNRRSFLKKLPVIAGLAQLPLLGWSDGFRSMLSAGINPGGEFSLLKLEKLLSGYQFPVINQFSTTSFNLEYKLYNLYGDATTFAGEMLLNAVKQDDLFKFDFTNWRWADNGIKNRVNKYRYYVSGNVHCAVNETFSPHEWEVSSRISLSEEGAPYGGSGLLNRGKTSNREVIIQTNGRPIKKAYGKTQLSWKWGLPAIVQKMAESSQTELQFALLDEFDAIYQNQKLTFRKKVKLDCGDQQLIDFKVFELTGDGVIPTVYWVDNMNRTVFIISGMEAYVLN